MATTAISAASSPYSSRSWPSALFANRPIATHTRFIELPPFAPGSRADLCSPRKKCARLRRRCRSEGCGDAPEDVVHVRPRQRDGAHRDERDERHQQRVLEQVLAFVVSDPTEYARQPHLHEQSSNEFVDYAAGVVPSAAAMRPKIEFTFVPASVMAPTATSAMRATRSAYSRRS